MSVVVTGGAGYIGSHMVWELLDNGEHVVVLDRLSSGFDWAVPPEAPLVVGDVGDSDLVARIIREHSVDAIIHFAGSLIVPESVSDPLLYYENNTCKTRSLIATAVREKVPHFIFSSTAAVYGTAGIEPVREDARTAPESPYGTSKLMTEWILRDTAAAYDGFDYTVLRYFNVAGADPQARTGQSTAGATHLIKVAVEAALGKRDHVGVFGTDYDTPDGTGVRDYIHVSDLAAAHVLALEALIEASERSLTMNCGYGRGFSVLEVLDAVDRVTNRTIDRRMADRRAGDPDSLISDNSRIKATLPWVPRYAELDTIVTHALAWERKLGEIRGD